MVSLKTIYALAQMVKCQKTVGAVREDMDLDEEDMDGSIDGEDKFQFTPMSTLTPTRLLEISLTQSTTSPPPNGLMENMMSLRVCNAHVTWKSSLPERKTSTKSLNKLPNLLLNSKR
jgi:hypothetical protein